MGAIEPWKPRSPRAALPPIRVWHHWDTHAQNVTALCCLMTRMPTFTTMGDWERHQYDELAPWLLSDHSGLMLKALERSRPWTYDELVTNARAIILYYTSKEMG